MLPSRVTIVAIGLACTLGGGLAWAQEAAQTKIGFVDVERSLVSIAEGRGRLKALQDWARPRQEELRKLSDTIATLQQQLNTAQGDAAADIQKQLVARQREFEDRQRSAQRDLEERRQSILKDIGDKMNKVITEYADGNRFTAVFILRQNDVAYLANSADITDTIIKLYDQKYPFPPQAPAPTK